MMAVDVSFPVPPSQFPASSPVQVPLRRSSRLAHGAHSIFAHSHSYPTPFPQRRKRQRTAHRLDSDNDTDDNDNDSDPLTPRALRALKRARLAPAVAAAFPTLSPQPSTSTHRTRRRKENATVDDNSSLKKRGDTKRPASKRPSPPRAKQHSTPLSTQFSDNLPKAAGDEASSRPSISIPDLSSTKTDSQQSSPAPRSITPGLSIADEPLQFVPADTRISSPCSPLTPLTPSPEISPVQLPHSPQPDAIPDEVQQQPSLSEPTFCSENEFAAMSISEAGGPAPFDPQSSSAVSFCETSSATPLSPLSGPSSSLVLDAEFSQVSMDLDNPYHTQEASSDQTCQRVTLSPSARSREVNIWKLACQERVDIIVRRYGPETIKALVAAEATQSQDDHYSATPTGPSEGPVAGPGPNTTRFRLYTPANYTYGSSLSGGDEEEDDDLGYISTHRPSHEGEMECEDDEEDEDDDDYEDFDDDFGDAEMETGGGASASVASNPVSNENRGIGISTAPEDRSAGYTSTSSEKEISSAEAPAPRHGQESNSGITPQLELGTDPATCDFSMNVDVPFPGESPSTSSPQFASPVVQSHTASQEASQNQPFPYPELSSNAAYHHEPSSPHSHFNFRAPQNAAFSRLRTPFRVPRLSSLQVTLLSEPPRVFMGRGTPPNRQRASDWVSGSPFDHDPKAGHSKTPVYLHPPSPPSPSPFSRSAPDTDFQPSSRTEAEAGLDMSVDQSPDPPGGWTSFLYAMLGSDNSFIPGTPELTTGTQSGVVQEDPAGSGGSWYEMGLGNTSSEHAGVAMSPTTLPNEGESSELRFALG